MCGQPKLYDTSNGMWPNTKHWKALAITTKKKNLGITEYETLAIIPAAKRVRQPLTWLRVQGTIVTKRTAHEYKDSNPHQYYSAPTHFSTTL